MPIITITSDQNHYLIPDAAPGDTLEMGGHQAKIVSVDYGINYYLTTDSGVTLNGGAVQANGFLLIRQVNLPDARGTIIALDSNLDFYVSTGVNEWMPCSYPDETITTETLVTRVIENLGLTVIYEPEED